MNFFLCRKPGETAVHSGYSEKLSEGIHAGFIFAPFGESAAVYTIPSDFKDMADKSSLNKWSEENEDAFRESAGFPDASTEKNAHGKMVEHAIATLHNIKDSTGISGKIIVARIETAKTDSRPVEIFNRLCKYYPGAFTFLFSTPVSGTWIGASPELLIDYDGSCIRTLSLAGTRPVGKNLRTSDAGSSAEISNKWDKWDDKNTEEQKIVTDFITSTLRDRGLSVSQSKPYTRNAGSIEHIATDISAIATDGITLKSIETLLKSLAPTPALSGFPRKEAIDFILRNEAYPRHYYGGFAGLMTPENEISAFVNLRSGRYDHTRGIILYAGGGITAKSIPEQEWTETHRKLKTLKSAL